MARDFKLALLWTFIAIAWLSHLVSIASASQFSADIVSTNTDGQPAEPPGKVYVSNDKVRIETPDVAGGFFIIDSATNAAFFVRPSQRVFMDAKQSSPLTQILVPVDPGDPCRKWQAMAGNAGATETGGQWRCNKVGEAIIEGRETISYTAVSPREKADTQWIDTVLGFLVRSQTDNGVVIDLKNIQEGPQPASPFEIPASYSKFDPRRLIEIIKRSDVWVEPNK